MSRVRAYFWYGNYGSLGFSILPYQIAFGFSLRLFEGLGVRVYIGPLKLLLQMRIRKGVE